MSTTPDYDSLDDEERGVRMREGLFTFYFPTVLYQLNKLGIRQARFRRLKTQMTSWRGSLRHNYGDKCVQIVLLMDKWNIDRSVARIICGMCQPLILNKEYVTKRIIVPIYGHHGGRNYSDITPMQLDEMT